MSGSVTLYDDRYIDIKPNIEYWVQIYYNEYMINANKSNYDVCYIKNYKQDGSGWIQSKKIECSFDYKPTLDEAVREIEKVKQLKDKINNL